MDNIKTVFEGKDPTDAMVRPATGGLKTQVFGDFGRIWSVEAAFLPRGRALPEKNGVISVLNRAHPVGALGLSRLQGW